MNNLTLAKNGNQSMQRLPLGKTLSLNVGTLHFVGIGGIGMSGIAEILHNLGYRVQGSDVAESANVQRLRDMGIRVMVGHAAENVENASVVVKSTAVVYDNPEIVAARKLRIPVVKRSEMLAELMRLKMTIAISGTHGKTTTTSLTATLLDAAGLHPTIINGGIINAYGTNARLGKGEWMVVEADESDGTFTRIPLTIGVVTNMDAEHLDYYGDFATMRQAYAQFLDNLPFYGFGVLCLDHPEVQALAAETLDRRIITYGFNPQADVRVQGVTSSAEGQHFDVVIAGGEDGKPLVLKDFFLPMHGQHNVLNALAAITIARELQVEDAQIREGLRGFGGVKRRFTETGRVGGVRIIDDYAHHPVEIAATLSSARQTVSGTEGRVIAVWQPHRYSRVQSLLPDFMRCFNDADTVLVSDIYSAGEKPLEGIDREQLVQGLTAAGHRDARGLESPEALAGQVRDIVREGDIVVCLGAGSVTYWAAALPGQLEALAGGRQAV